MIRLENVVYHVNGTRVLDGVDLTVEEGEVFVIMGTSGAGKTTILRLLNGLERPTAGRVIVGGEDITGLSEQEMARIRRRVALVFQSAALFDSLPVWENVAFPWRKERLSREECLARVRRILSLVGLEGVEDRMPAELSGGMQKRVSLARALAMEPDVILYDEPTAGLDPITSEKILHLLLDLQERLKVTSVVVTHDLDVAALVGTRVALLHEGKIVFVGSPEALRDSTNPVVKRFMGRLGNADIP